MKKTHFLRNTIIVLLVCAIAGTIWAAILFNKEGSRTYAVATIQFSFDGAGEGKAPNGYPFNVKGISADEVIAAALAASGLTGTYTEDQIRENLDVTAVYPDNIVKQMTRYTSLLDADADQQAAIADYHATIYDVKLYNDFDSHLSSGQLTELLNNLLTAYRTYFAKVFGPGYEKADPISDLQEYDYVQQLTVISEASSQENRYAQQMATLAPDFQLNGKGFDDISIRLDSLDRDIDRLNANISLNTLSKNRKRLQTQYEMEIRTLSRELASDQEELTRIEEMVAAYEKDGIVYVSTSETLEKITGNASDTYDQLVVRRKALTDNIATTKADISRYEDLLEDMTRNAGQSKTTQAKAESETTETTDQNMETEEETVDTSVELTETEAKQLSKIAEQQITELSAKKNAITDDFITMLNAYTAQEINERTVSMSNLKYKAPSYFSSAFIITVIKTAGPLCVLGLIVCLLILVISRRKEEKRA